MKSLNILILLAFVFCTPSIEAYRILCFFPYEGKSHFLMPEVLCQGLAKKGHQIDMISHYPRKEPIANYTDIVDLTGTRRKIVNNVTVKYGKEFAVDGVYVLSTTFGNEICEIMGHEKMMKFIRNPPNDPPYDLVITEYFGSACNLGFGPFLKVPVAIIVTNIDKSVIHDFMGSPLNYAFIPGMPFPKSTLDTFFDRLWNFVLINREIQFFYYYTNRQTEIMRKYLGQDIPDVRELERKVSLTLTNGHHSLYGSRPMVPGIVEVAGLHIQPETETKLDPELQNWLDSADHGLVYFTLGSMMNIETLPNKTILGLYSSFAKLAPIKVLMKSANPAKLPPGMPQNMITSSWIPQLVVLGHKNTRVFITHGGLMGTQEAIYYGVPIIGIPVFADQPRNMQILVRRKMAYLLNIDNINEQTMDAALNAVLHNPQYKESAKKMSRLFRDRPLAPLDTAIFWIEYVIKYGPDVLRSPLVDMPWWKACLVDVIVFLIACAAFAIGLLIVLIKMVLKQIRGDSAKYKKKLE